MLEAPNSYNGEHKANTIILMTTMVPRLRDGHCIGSARGYIGGTFSHQIPAPRTRCRRRRSSLPQKQTIIVLRTSSEALRYVDHIQAAADTEKDALGFLPANVYEEAARKGCIFVAVTADGRAEYAGHVMFGNKFPYGRVYQTYVLPQFRGFGTGKKLIQALVTYAEGKGFLSLTARVAQDLQEANAFYDGSGFETLKTELGGQTRKRLINIRVRALDTPALFGYRERVSGLPLADPIPAFAPVFTIDLNVFFDVAKRRPRSTYAGPILSAAYNNLVQLTATEELANELRRTSFGESDTALEFASQLPTLSAPADGFPSLLLERLAQLVFPDRANRNALTKQDVADIRHLAIAAHHTVSAFVTAEDALVAASPAVEDLIGLRIIHVSNLATSLRNALSIRTPLDVGFAGGDLRLCELGQTHINSLERLTENLDVPKDIAARMRAFGLRATGWKTLVVALEAGVVAAASWKISDSLNSTLEVFLVCDDAHAASEVASDILLHQLSQMATSDGPCRVQLTIPRLCTTIQRVALRCGYTKCKDENSSKQSRFQRLSVGGMITTTNWEEVRRGLKNISSMTFPASLPSFVGPAMRIDLQTSESREYSIDLFDLETSLSPTVVLLHGRPAVLTPIQAQFADHLLGTAEQGSLFPRRGANALHERTYFCSPRTQRLFDRGTIVVFYESGAAGGRMAATAIARVRNAEVISKRKIAQDILESGVLDAAELEEVTTGEQVTALTFDNVLRLNRPVSLARLRALGCIDGSNAITSRAITPTQLQQIVEEGEVTRA